LNIEDIFGKLNLPYFLTLQVINGSGHFSPPYL
jgi:hypothetical protein